MRRMTCTVFLATALPTLFSLGACRQIGHAGLNPDHAALVPRSTDDSAENDAEQTTASGSPSSPVGSSAAPSAASPANAVAEPTASVASGATPASPRSAPAPVKSHPREETTRKKPSKTPAAATAAATTPAQAPAAGAAGPVQAAASATLDLSALEQRLKETKAIGVFTKLSLKNQVDDLLADFKAFHSGSSRVNLAELRQRYDLLLLKVLSLLQDADQPLAAAISSSREAIWNILTDPKKFSAI